MIDEFIPTDNPSFCFPFSDNKIFNVSNTLRPVDHKVNSEHAPTRSWVSVVLREWIMSERWEARSRRSLMGTAAHVAHVHNTGDRDSGGSVKGEIKADLQRPIIRFVVFSKNVKFNK